MPFWSGWIETAKVLAALTTTTRGLLDFGSHLLRPKDVTPRESDPDGRGSGRPRLPPRRPLVGRDQEVAKVHESLRSVSPVTCIAGPAGIGKTALALAVAHEADEATRRRLLPRFLRRTKATTFDAVVWIAPPPDGLLLDHVVDTLARTLGYPVIARMTDDKAEALRVRVFRTQAVLLVVDNVDATRDAALLDFLRLLPEPSKALVTSREHDVVDSRPVVLRPLATPHALQLMNVEAKRLLIDRIAACSATQLDEVLAAAGGSPLAIKWAMGQIAQRGQTIESVTRALTTAHASVLNDMFARSWTMLVPRERRILLSLRLAPSPLLHEALAAVAGGDVLSLDEAVGRLVQMSLVEATGAVTAAERRYGLHPLTRAFVEAHATESSRWRDQILRDSFQYVAALAGTEMARGWPRAFAYSQDADTFVASIEWAFGVCPARGHEAALALKWFFWELGLWSRMKALYGKGIEIAKADSQPLWLGRYANEQGWTSFRQDDHRNAHAWATRAEQAFAAEAGNDVDHANLTCLRAMLANASGDTPTARRLLTVALQKLQTVQTAPLEKLRVMTYLGEIDRREGKLDEARSRFTQTLDESRRTGIESGEAWSLGNIGEIDVLCGRLDDAREHLVAGLTLAQRLQRYHTIIECTYWLGELERRAKHYSRAKALLAKAEDGYRRLGIGARAEAAARAQAESRYRWRARTRSIEARQ